MEAVQAITRLDIWHRDHNLAMKHNLHELPDTEAVFGIFAIVQGEPINCRHVSHTTDLRKAVQDMFETQAESGLQKFMQGPWVQTLLYVLMPGSSAAEREKLSVEWTLLHKPNIDEDGEYPGYYDY